jgi:RimJ/RimL family protein N-acetyltransferase
MQLDPAVLQGSFVRLEPLTDRHIEALAAAALSDPAIWTHIPYPVRDRSDVDRILARARALQSARMAIVFATCAGPDRTVVGSTSIRVSDPDTPSVEIGGTWIVPRWQRTQVNTEAKLLQMTHCFEVLGVARTEWKTDARNARSRAAILRLGAVEEGTLRHHMRRHDGTMRDSVYFSILAGEWPAAKRRLEARLAGHDAA